MLMPLRCPHLTVHRQMLPWQKQPLPRGKASWRSGGMPSYWEIQQSCTGRRLLEAALHHPCFPKGLSHHTGAPGEAAPKLCKDKHSTFRNYLPWINLLGGGTCFLQTHTSQALFSLVKILRGSEGWHCTPTSEGSRRDAPALLFVITLDLVPRSQIRNLE